MRVVLFTGGVETLDYFSVQLKRAFEKRGCLTFLLDLVQAKQEAKRLKKFMKTGETFCLTFNFEGLEREEGLYSLRDSYLWQQYRVPVFNIAADHPYWYDNRYRDLLEDEAHHPGLLSLYHQFSVDRLHEAYLKEFYPEFQNAGFLPLAGTDLDPSEPLVPAAKRKAEILFTGHYTELPFFEPAITAVNEEYMAFYRSILAELIENPEKPVDKVVIRRFSEETGEQDKKQLRFAIYRTLFFDLYVRNHFRGKAVAALCNAGLPVTLIGKGWEKLPLKRRDTLTILPKTDSLGCLRAQREYRIALNVMPYFKDGAHDRVFNGILNGMPVLTDESRYLCEELPEGAGVSYYRLSRLDTEELPEKAERLLSDPALCDEILARGLPFVRSRHTWDARADVILQCYRDLYE